MGFFLPSPFTFLEFWNFKNLESVPPSPLKKCPDPTLFIIWASQAPLEMLLIFEILHVIKNDFGVS